MTNLLLKLQLLWCTHSCVPRRDSSRRLPKLTFLIAFVLFPLISPAANLTLQGNFTADDNIQFFSVSLAAPAAVDFSSYGYGGGTTSTGTVAAPGGFDTILTLFSSSGAFLNENDDGAGAAEDPSTGMPGDARITANLAAGSYILALTQFDNFSIGDLADGFAETGHPNFTADPAFTSGGACAGNMFRDILGTDGRCRTGNWTVDFLNISSVAPIAVPEPSALLLAGVGLALLLMGRLRSRKKETLLTPILLAALATSPVQAQSDPDFTNVKDILHGNRTLLQITDLQVVTWTKDSTQLNFNQLLTSNSSVTKTSSSSANIPPDIYNPYGTKSFSGSMFNQPQPVTVTEVAAEQTESNLYLVTTNIQNAGPWFSPIQEYNAFQFTAGAMADFNNDGYDDFAFSFDDGNIAIATAADVNNPWAGSSGPFKLGPLTQLDKLTDMTAGDFKGDGQH
ncbi:MAG TPA: DVUA0089 family protein, partial [Terriglobales bacterium]|nr:DVUA0089 family protein [Terriglobales bacterium]